MIYSALNYCLLREIHYQEHSAQRSPIFVQKNQVRIVTQHIRWYGITLLILWIANTASQGQTTLSKLKNYVAISEKLHTCGSIDEKDLAQMKSAGISTIISLSTESPSQIRLHKETASGLGMRYIHIPVSWKKPTIASLQAFFDAMDAHKQAGVLVHCRLNWRASAYTYLYRRVRLASPDTEAKPAMLEVWNPDKDRVWSAFINRALQHFEIK